MLAIFDFASEWSQPGPWFWPLGGGINTAAAVWLVMSNNRLLIYLLNILNSCHFYKNQSKSFFQYHMSNNVNKY